MNNVSFYANSSPNNISASMNSPSVLIRRNTKKDNLTESVEFPPTATPAQKGLLKIMHRIEKRKAASIDLAFLLD